MGEKILEIEDLRVDFARGGEVFSAVKGVSFSVERGSALGIVGESGSGKSVSTLSLMGLLPPPPLCRVSGSVTLFSPQGNERFALEQDSWQRVLKERRLLGRHIAMIFQEPMTSLNPVRRCGAQVAEMLIEHEGLAPKEARSRVIALFEEVRLPRPEAIFDSYPHEISGGQKQRVMIAMAMACRPDLLIADEPTTALDVTVQKEILELMRSLQKKHNIGIIFITHDLAVIAQIADRVAVMYHGEIVEQGDASAVLTAPSHPYTQGLLACRPPMDSRPKVLPTVRDFLNGVQPSAAQRPLFVPREGEEPLLSVRNLEVRYRSPRRLFGRKQSDFVAVQDLSFDLFRGETVGLVGESGCGKSTLGRSLLDLVRRNAGTVRFGGVSIDTLGGRQRKRLRQKIQIVFQDPYSSLNPRQTIGEALLEPLACHRLGGTAEQRRMKVRQLMERVGLDPNWANRYPHEFSGGQRQRVCIARALVLDPELIVCDECVSALDVSVQAQVLNLLNELKEQYGFSCLFITHDLSVVKYFSDRILVMQQGHIVECSPSDRLFSNPRHPYTRRLLSSLPRI